MIFFAIKHLPTGGYMPANGKRRGYSHDEPVVNCTPRLFPSHKNANLALKAWLRGEMNEVGYDSYTKGYDNEVKVTPKEHRKAEEMKIVEMRLEEIL